MLHPPLAAAQLSSGPFGIPALQRKASFGIGVSGGGLRAAFLALGWLRGMHMLGHLAKARYLGSASGGSFASSMISYTDPDKLTENFGKYTPPEYATVAGMQVGGQSVWKGPGLTCEGTFHHAIRV